MFSRLPQTRRLIHFTILVLCLGLVWQARDASAQTYLPLSDGVWKTLGNLNGGYIVVPAGQGRLLVDISNVSGSWTETVTENQYSLQGFTLNLLDFTNLNAPAAYVGSFACSSNSATAAVLAPYNPPAVSHYFLLGIPANDQGVVQAVDVSWWSIRATYYVRPTISVQPKSLTASPGTSATFSVTAAGQDISYQWHKGGAAVLGATSSNYTIQSVAVSDAGNYDVVVSNPAGSVGSTLVTLTVPSAITFTGQPHSVTSNVGSTVYLVASATGSTPMTWHWFKDGTYLTNAGAVSDGGTTAVLTIAPARTTDSGRYWTTVTNPYGAATSATATVLIGVPPSVTSQPPATIIVQAGDSATLQLETTGTPPIAFQWKKNGTNVVDGGNISGSSTSTLTIQPASSADVAVYSATITNAFGRTTSRLIPVDVPAPAAITTGLQAYYQFDDATGKDSSPNHLDLTMVGNPHFAQGIHGLAIDLHHDGNQYAERPVDDPQFDFQTNDFSIQVWIDLYTVFTYEQTLVEKFYGQAGPGWTITSPSPFIRFAAYPILPAFESSPNISTNQWHQLILRRSQTNFDLVFDGTPVATTTATGAITSTSNGLLVGRRNLADPRDFSVNGRLDELAFWNRCLTDREITALYNAGQGVQMLPISLLPPATAQGNAPIQLSWAAIAGQTYEIQYKTDPFATNWVSLGRFVARTNGTFSAQVSVGTQPEGFFRVALTAP